MIINEKCGIFARGLSIPQEKAKTPIVSDENPYQYLGFDKGEMMTSKEVIERLKEASLKMDEIVETNASGFNTIHMTNTMIMAKLRYTFAAAEWRMQDIECINKVARMKLYDTKVYSKTLLKERLYIKRDKMGLGLMDA